jgi:hypothetical protein
MTEKMIRSRSASVTDAGRETSRQRSVLEMTGGSKNSRLSISTSAVAATAYFVFE